MPKNKVISILADQKLLDRIDKARLREPRSSFLYRLIDDALKTKLRKKRSGGKYQCNDRRGGVDVE